MRTEQKGRDVVQNLLKKHPWCILAAGAAIQILTGIPSAWGAFQKPVGTEYGFSAEQTALAFSFIICFFGIGCVLGGLLQDRFGPRTAGLCGSALLAIGFLSAGWWLPAQKPILFYTCFSAPVGLGCAFLYPAVMSCAQKWYADRKGLATGVIGGAVGLSGAALTLLVRGFNSLFGIRTALCLLGAILGIVCGAGSLFLHNPPAPPQQKTSEDVSLKDMLKSKQYRLLFFITCLATPSVLLFSPKIVEMAQERGLSEAVGLSFVWAGSLSSAAGRLSMAALSDHIGRRKTDCILFAALAGLSVLFFWAQGWWMLAVYCLLTFCYSGEAAVLPSLVTDLFGQKQAGIHYGFVSLGMSTGSLLFPIAANAFHLQTARHWLAAAAALGGFLLLLRLKPLREGQRI